MAREEPVLIAGGGIAGLATALALAKRGIPSRVLEQRERFSESGAGIQIGPNGVRVLTALGVAAPLVSRASAPTEIVVHQGSTGRVLTRMPLGDWIARRHGAPYWVVHRGDLQLALVEAVRAEPAIDITMGSAVAEALAGDDRAAARKVDGTTLTGPILIGADGIRSRVRAAVAPQAQLAFSGKAASRALLPADAAGPLNEVRTGVWLAPGAHVVHYPVEGGKKIAVVAIVPDDRRIDDWAAPNDWSALAPHLAGFAPTLRDTLGCVPEWRRWAVFDGGKLLRLTAGRVALVGDAAHPVLPFLAQGGVMALEDAAVLAHCLAERRDDPLAALRAYEVTRYARIAAVAAASRQNGRIFHLSGPAALARNLALTMLPPALLMARYDWVYGWQPPA